MKRALSLCLVALIAAGCGSDGDGDDDTTAAPAGGQVATFESPQIGFSFDYPKGLAAKKRPREDVLARVGIERDSRLNSIKVRRTARRELDPERYLDAFHRDFERTVGMVEQREERIGDLDTGVLEFDDTIRRRGETVEFTSSSYFFTGGGQTWQVECISDADHRAEIEAACRTALESVDFDS